MVVTEVITDGARPLFNRKIAKKWVKSRPGMETSLALITAMAGVDCGLKILASTRGSHLVC